MEADPVPSGLYIGTSGWSYGHWREVFYPADLKTARYLEFYLTKFNCVELNSSFYHLPKEKTVEGWMRRTPGTFRFCPKISRFITHQKHLSGCGEALKNFFDVFEGMRSRMGPLLIQITPGLSRDDALITDFFELLGTHGHSFRFAVEVRHRSWIADPVFELLSRYGIAFVIADSDGRFPFSETVITDMVYLRLHGPEQLYASDYDESQLRRYAEKIIHWLGTGHEVWVFFNNDFHGYAVKNALKLCDLIHSMQ